MRGAFRLASPIAPGLVSRQAYRLWFKTQRHPLPAREKPALESAHCAFINLGEKRIATYSWGETGPWILLVHGWSGRGTQMAPFIEPLLKSGYRVLSFDAPGHGKSDGNGTSAFEIIDTLALLEKQYGAFHAIITHSFGGLCTAAALSGHINAQHAVLISSPASLLGLLDTFSCVLQLSEKVQAKVQTLAEQQFGKDMWQRMDTRENVRTLSLPGLIIHDEDDHDVPWQDGMEIAKAWPKARFIKTSRLGHRRILRDSSIITAAIDFISRGDSNTQPA
jgi:pimeloyl-ACP methyl ester carboxylesterase